MEIVGTNMEEEQKKNKKLMTMITIFIVLLLIISVVLGLAIYYLKSKQFKFFVDGKSISKYSSDLFVFKDNITEAASSVWQCSNCGYRINSGGTNPPRNSYGCGGDFNRRHSFQRIK